MSHRQHVAHSATFPAMAPHQKRSPLAQWVASALHHAGDMSQSELARRLAERFPGDPDRSKVNKILKDRRKVPAEEMLAIEEITGYPAPSEVWKGLVKGDLRSEDIAAGFDGRQHDTLGPPLVAWVNAGKFADVQSQLPPRRLKLDIVRDLGPGDYFATKVEGDSMDRVSPPGSIIIVDRNDKVLVSGKYYVFAIGGKTTYKTYMSGDPPYLAPYTTNPTNPPIFIRKKSDIEIVGRVKRTLLDL